MRLHLQSKFTITGLLFFVIFTCTTTIAQTTVENKYPNELEGFEFFKDGKWKSLVPYVSTKKDVRKIFGSDCKEGCKYNKDWRVQVSYVGQVWRSPSFAPCVDEELVGRFEKLNFIPRKTVSFKSIIFPEVFQSSGSFWVSHMASPRIVYYDTHGLVYTLLSEEYDEEWKRRGYEPKTSQSSNLLYISYRISKKDAEKVKNKDRCFDFDDNASDPNMAFIESNAAEILKTS